ncbi:MAG: S8 family peptidase [Bacteroidota bacterium]
MSARALDRRTRYGISIDSTDLPVSTGQLNQIGAIPNLTILNTSKWLNAVAIQTTDPNVITAITALPFVQSADALAARSSLATSSNKFESEEQRTQEPSPQRIQADYFNYGTGSLNEIHLHQGEFLHNIGLRGQGMQIALLDGGYYNYTILKAFDSINANGQVLSTWDFVSRNASVVEDHPHGMQCLSTIAANIPGQFIGKAPKASFHLFRTEEVATEFPIEEFNWVCGAERADSIGAEMISSSLGYNTFDNSSFDHTYSQLNGNTTMAAIGADIGAKKGMLILVAAGNEGSSGWHYITTPSDADSVLCVGAVNTSGAIGSFSSYGPSADGQIKPDLASVGVTALIQGTDNTVVAGNGTSFACPNMAGLAACLWQGFPEFNNMRIVQTLRESSDRYNNPDDRTGFGIPNMKTAFGKLLSAYATSSSAVTNCNVTIQWNSKDVATMRYEIERRAPGESTFSKIGEIAAKPGVVLSNQSYQFQHTLSNIGAGTVQFRIRQLIDTTTANFTAVYIDTTSLNLPSACYVSGINNDPAVTLKVYIAPNPSLGNAAQLILESDRIIGLLQLELIDTKGSTLRTFQLEKRNGRQLLSLPANELPSGQYIVRISKGNAWLQTLQWVLVR